MLPSNKVRNINPLHLSDKSIVSVFYSRLHLKCKNNLTSSFITLQFYWSVFQQTGMTVRVEICDHLRCNYTFATCILPTKHNYYSQRQLT
jgi:hypothetical protein